MEKIPSIYEVVEAAEKSAHRATRRNPVTLPKEGQPSVEPTDRVGIFIQMIKEYGLDSYTEWEMAEAGIELGIPEEDIPAFLQQVASWL